MTNISYGSSLRMNMNDYRGLSAYEIAVKNGFEGTEQEWIDSLKGEPGKSADTLTVNKKRPIDGNINLSGADINLYSGTPQTVAEAIDEISKSQTSGLTSADIVNDLTTGGEGKVLSAEMGARLEHTKPEVFWATLSIPTTGWTGTGPYTQDIALDGVLSNPNTCAIHYSADVGSEDAFSAVGLRVTAQKTDALTVRVNAKPTSTFDINVYVTILKTRGDS